jgi:hypothetical protein
MNASLSYQGWSKKDGWCFGSTPTLLFIFEIVRDEFSAGVGNPKTLSPVETTGVVVRIWRSASEKRQGIPKAASRSSTCNGVKEIVSDIINGGVLACGTGRFELHRPHR